MYWVHRCIMDEVKQYHRNLAVAFYDYNNSMIAITALFNFETGYVNKSCLV